MKKTKEASHLTKKMKSLKKDAEKLFIRKGFEVEVKWWGVQGWVNGIIIAWNWDWKYPSITIGADNSNDDIVRMELLLRNLNLPVTIGTHRTSEGGKLHLMVSPTMKNLECTIDILSNLDFDLDKYSLRKKEFGVSFEGTFFSDLKERGATLSGMFGNMVCEAAGMKLINTKAEKYIGGGSGQIDGVEYDDNRKIISIYECNDGIFYGKPLDDHHLNKVLERYLYDPEIIPTVRKVVILAGAYSKYHLNIIKERAYDLSLRNQPIEIVLLKTIREGDEIGIVRVDYQNC